MGISVYTVYEPPDAPADRLDRAESHVLIKEGFSWAAALLAPFWLLAHGMWIVLAGYVVAVIVIQVALALLGLGQLGSLLMVALHVLVGFEADVLRRWTLERKGWRMIGSVVGRSMAECERRFFNAWLKDEPYIRADALSAHGGSLPLAGAAERRQGRWRFPLTRGS